MMTSTTTIAISVLPILVFTLWFLSSTISTPAIPDNLKNKRIILLIAHPDDESMFFSPALQALTQPLMGNHLKILCMSTGDADGLGETRRKELESAALTLGVRRREDIFVMDDDRFKDGMKTKWDPREVARVLAQAFAPQLISPTPTPSTPSTPRAPMGTSEKKTKDKEKEKKKSSSSFSLLRSSKSSSSSITKSGTSKSATVATKNKSTSAAAKQESSSPAAPVVPEGPRATIDILLTFDKSGISSHPNHIALYHGSSIFLQQIMRDHTGYKCPVDLYTLTTINILRKYSFIADLIPTYISGIVAAARDRWTKPQAAKAGRRSKDDRVVFVSGVGRYMKARKAMVQGHVSQMVWFRWAWIALGRYMVVNDLRRESVPGT